MGYCTTFVISVEDGNPSEGEFDRISHMLETYEDFEFWGDEWVASDVKWYDYNDDMHRLSKEFPQFRFYVHGDGDDSDDLWEDHWQDGRYQHCCAEIPPYDPTQMTEYHREEEPQI